MKKVFMAGALLGAMFLQSCDDNDFRDNGGGIGVPMEPGTTIDFGAGLSAQTGSRTVYGEESTSGVKIHWKYSSAKDEEQRNKGLDSIYIFSPHSDSGEDRGVYLVNPDGEKSINYAPVIAAKEDQKLVAKKAEQAFYAVYPSSAILKEPTAGDADNVWIYGVLSAHQTVTVDPAKITDNMMVAEHDMKLCFMKAVHPNYALTSGHPVRLQFQPWSTVLDITIPGPAAAHEGKDYCEVTQVLVRTRKADKTGEGVSIAGTFRCNLKTDEIEFTRMPDETSTVDESNHIVNIDIVQPDGTRGVKLGIGQSLNLKGFILPVADVEAVEVEVYSADNRMWGVFLRNDSNRDRLLEPGQIHRVTLPDITLPGRASYSSWMTNLSDDILVTNMSIPGSYMSFTYDLTGNDQLQSFDIEEQFNAGVRAFHGMVRFAYEDDPFMPGVQTLDNQSPARYCHLEITTNGSDNMMPLGKAIHELHQEMQSRGNREFCVLFLRVESNYGTLPHMLECLKKYADKMNELGLVDKEVPTDFTLGNFRGKILLQVTLAGDPSLNGLEWAYRQDVKKDATLSPGHAIEQWIADSQTTVGTWYGSVEQWSRGGLNAWKSIDGAPLLLSWETSTHKKSVGLTPVTYGRVGDWEYSPRFANQNELLTAYPGYASNYYEQRIYNGWTLAPKIPTDPSRIGLGYINASIIAANAKLLGVADGMTNDYLYRADLDIDMTKLANGDYPVLGKENAYNESIFWWLHGENYYKEPNAGTMWSMVRSIWETTSSLAYTSRTKFGERLFLSTVLGANGFNGSVGGQNAECTPGASFYAETNWCNWVANKSVVDGTSNLYFNVSGIKVDIPLGIVFLPHVPSQDTKLETVMPNGRSDIEGYKKVGFYNTNQIIGAMISHNDKFDPVKTGGN